MNNPFISKITSDNNGQLDSVGLLVKTDYETYLIYEETHKVYNPEAYKFLNQTINFMAFKRDSMNVVSSMVLYIKHSTNLFEILKREFGNPTSTFSLSGEIQASSSEQMKYESIAWKQDGYIMMVALAPDTLGGYDSRTRALTRVWIKKLDNQDR